MMQSSPVRFAWGGKIAWLVIALTLLAWCGDMGKFYILSDFRKIIPTTVTRAVGPTELTSARGTLPQPTPNNTNSIWVAPNGNDGNAGTQALPKLTIAGAIAALTVTATNVQIFRNGYVGELLFSSTAAFSLPASRSMQVADGEYAVIYRSNAGSIGTVGAASTVNGIWFDALDTTGITMSAASVVQNCMVTGENRTRLSQVSGTDVSYTFSYSVCGGIGTTHTNATLRTVTITNSILFNSNASATGVLIMAQTVASANALFNVTRSYIMCKSSAMASGVWFAFMFGVGTFTATGTINLNGCVLGSSSGNLGLVSGNGSDTVNMTVTMTNCKNNAGSAVYDGGATASTISQTLTQPGALPTGKPSMFRDEAGFLNTTTWTVDALDKLRLQIAGVRPGVTIASGPPWGISSPLKGAYLTPSPDEDAAPWDETQGATVTLFNGATQLEGDFAGGEVAITPQNPRETRDVTGNLKQAFDAVRRVFRFTPTSPMTFANDVRKLAYIQGDTGPVQRFYPRGNPADLDYDGGILKPIAVSGSIVAFNLEVTPTLINGVTKLVPNWWRGWVLEVGGLYEYYITENSTSQFTIEDRWGFGFPVDGTYSLAVHYILGVMRKNPPITLKTSFAPDFTHGRRWAEYEDGDAGGAGQEVLWEGGGFEFEEVDNPNLEG